MKRSPLNFVAFTMFDIECEGLLRCIRTALETPVRYDAWDGYRPYYGDVDRRAAWQARHVYREARRLGLLDALKDVAA